MALDVHAEDRVGLRARVLRRVGELDPALPRPPVSTCAFTTTGPPSSRAAASASSGVVATRPSETGIPNCWKSSLPWYS
jgi:hypothetical protein